MNQANAAVAYSESRLHAEPRAGTTHSDRRTLRRVGRLGAFVVVAGAALTAMVRWRAARVAHPLPLETVALDRGPIAAKVTATGAVSALVTVSVGSQVSGRIEKLLVDFGSTVRKGQTMATLDPAFFRAAVAQAKANYVAAKAAVDRAEATKRQAERSYARARELSVDGLVSHAELEAAEANWLVANSTQIAMEAGVSQAIAALDQAELNLRYTTIVSPIDGVVISRNVDVGQTVAAALYAPTLLLVAQDLTRMQVDTNVAEADVGKIQVGMPVTFTVDAYPARSFPGKVRQVRDNAQTIQNVVTYDAVIDVDNSEHLLKPGMTASVTFVHATRENALRLPNAALRFKPDAAFLEHHKIPVLPTNGGATTDGRSKEERTIWVRRGATSAPVTVRTGISDGSFTEILAGDLSERDEAVVQLALGPSSERAR